METVTNDERCRLNVKKHFKTSIISNLNRYYTYHIQNWIKVKLLQLPNKEIVSSVQETSKIKKIEKRITKRLNCKDAVFVCLFYVTCLRLHVLLFSASLKVFDTSIHFFLKASGLQAISICNVKSSSNHKQPLCNYEPWKSWKYKQLGGLGPDPSCLLKAR